MHKFETVSKTGNNFTINIVRIYMYIYSRNLTQSYIVQINKGSSIKNNNTIYRIYKIHVRINTFVCIQHNNIII